ncbi:MAG TPA: 50S ribosomal protein L23 [Chitinophagales bacterium]|nr:50S ribosomal protein L23 [Chitinophagales bacterium]
MSEILISPLISEKMNNLNQKLNKVGFMVSKESNKIQIKNEVEKMYGVTVKSVATSVVPGKAKSRYTKKGMSRGMKSSYKKAYITLAKGDTIDFYANV